ncbi:hypothetical protein [Roseibium aquae]|nr:hypothetical protein [Roseibium aquae]
MADYYSILKRTIASLPESNGAARRSVYSRARNAIVNQLKAYEPPLSPSEITAEQLRLEEAIRKVEAEAARESLGLGPSVKTAPASGPAGVSTPPASVPPQAAAPEASSQLSSGYGQASVAPDTNIGAGRGPSQEPPAAPYVAPGATEPQPSGERQEPSASGEVPPARDEREPGERVGAVSSGAVAGNRRSFDDQPEQGLPEPRQEPAFSSPSASVSDDDDSLFVAETSADGNPIRPGSIAAGQVTDAGRRGERKSRKRAAEALSTARRPSMLHMLLIAVLILILASIGGVIYSQRDLIASLTGPSQPAEPEGQASVPVDDVSDAPGEEANGAPQKNTARLLDGNGEPPVAPDARSVTTTLITPGQTETRLIEPDPPVSPIDVPATPPVETPPPAGDDGSLDAATPNDPASAEGQQFAAVAPETATAPGPDTPSAQRSILYEEGAEASGAGTASQGAVVWRLEDETALDGQKQVVLVADVEIPERNVRVNLRIKPNDDNSLPASHLVEIKYELPKEFASGTVVNVPGLVMKPTEEARGDALLGASVKVSEGYFWIALSSLSSEQERNLGLLRERGWIDIPMLYTNGKRGILTLEKGATGSDAVERAIAAWAAG